MKSASRPGDEPRINRGSTAGQPLVNRLFCSSAGLHRNSFVRACKEPCRGIPGHALHEKGLQRQKGVGTLVSSQEQRALLVPVINRLSTACQPVVNRGFCSSIGLHSISLVRASRGTPRRSVFHRLGGKRVGFLLGEQSCRRRPVLPVPARPHRPAGRRPVPTRPGYVRVLDSTGILSLIPGHALHEKGLQRQITFGTLVNSQQRRALLVPLINRGSTGRFVPPPVYIGFHCSCLRRDVQNICTRHS